MSQHFKDVILGFWEIVISLLSRVKDIFLTNNRLNIFGYILLILLIISLIEICLNVMIGGDDSNDD